MKNRLRMVDSKGIQPAIQKWLFLNTPVVTVEISCRRRYRKKWVELIALVLGFQQMPIFSKLILN
jgi:hypothetical protein